MHKIPKIPARLKIQYAEYVALANITTKLFDKPNNKHYCSIFPDLIFFNIF